MIPRPDPPPGPPEGPEDLSGIDSTRETREIGNRTESAALPPPAPFESLSRGIRDLIEANMEEVCFAPGDLLIRQGDPGTSLLVIAAGECEVRVDREGKRWVLKRAGPGEVLGEMALLTGGPRTATVAALTPVTARVLPAARFEDLAARHPGIVTLLTALLASRLGRQHHDAMTGSTFHGYRILSCVGRGGMSVVYEAEQAATGRRVALKMMSHLLLQDEEARRRFDREAEILGAFDHPNIARVHGRFEAFRTSFIVMDLCDGISIASALSARGRLPEPEAKRILGQVSRAVRHAHEAGIVHRDIKPSNIMATRDGTVKLIDFGLACHPEDERLTGSLFGTPRYMAPEQMRGEPVTAASDLFALGHIAWEMVTGRRLFRSRGLRALRREVIACRIPDLDLALSGIGSDLRGVIGNLLGKDPGARRIDFDLVGSWAAPVDLASGEAPGPSPDDISTRS